MNQAKILDVKINKITITEVLEKIKSFLLSGNQHYIITLNPEMVVEAQGNDYFKDIINEADLVIPDGIGILWGLDFFKFFVSRDKGSRGIRRALDNSLAIIFALYKFVFSLLKLLFYPKHRKNILKHRIHGIDLIYKICEADFSRDKKIYFLGAGNGIAQESAKVLFKKYNHLNVVGAESGISNMEYGMWNKSQNSKCHPELVEGSTKITSSAIFKTLKQVIKRIGKICGYRQKILKQVQNDSKAQISCNNLIQRINKAQPDILFVAFGAPKQEEWIYKNLKKMSSVQLAIGVGGSFDFISGKIKRAPLIIQKLGLEWLWRLIIEPRRIKRIYNATLKFGWMVLRNSYKHLNI